MKNEIILHPPLCRNGVDNTGFIELAAAAAGSIFQAGVGIFQTSVQKSIAEKQLKLEREIATRQLDIQKSVTDAQVGLIKVQTTGLQKQQNIDLQIADSNKEVSVLENEIRAERLRAQRELEKIHEAAALEEAKNPRTQVLMQAQIVETKTENTQKSRISTISTTMLVAGGIGVLTIGLAIFRKPRKEIRE